MADFVHLHNHTEYSLLDGLQKTKNMVEYAKELGMKALAITDHGNMYGTIKFYKACLDAGIKPIIGCEIYVAKRSLHDKDAAQDKDYNHLILLAENETGYKNLMKIVTVSNLEGYYYKPRTDLELLQKYHEGLICLSACVNGYVAEPLLRDEDALAEERALKLSNIFGPNNFFLELQKHIDVEPQPKANEKLIALSHKLGLPVVATNDNHYTKKEDAEGQEILLCVQTQTTLLDTKRKLSMIGSPDFYIKSAEEMEKLFIDIPEAIENANAIAERCTVEIKLGKWHMPQFEVPNDMTAADYLTQLVYQGVKMRYGNITDEIKERVDYELSIIIKKKYETYFLVVSDFVNWAKDNGIAVGPGRGSAAGSVVSYALKITDADPFFFNLPFERFLNPLRPSAPDIDLDFADTRREEVIEYVTDKYGKDKVAQIITFGTMEARGSVRDTGRALGMPYAGPDRISKMIPPGWQGHAMSIDSALTQSPDLKRAYDSEKETKRLLDLAKKLEGVARHASVHAAGVVIADKPLTEYTPLQKETNGEKIVTQYDMYTVGEDGVGLLKMDFLGLRNLTIIEECLKFIKENKGETIDLNRVDLEDPKTYKLLSEGETTGIFQLESAGMRRYIKDLKPTTIFDLQAMVALYRPGPMAIIPEFIKRKHNPALITYPDPRLKDILKQSYGVLTYQDDVLLTAIELAGYSWLEADKFRKAMGKKIPAEMKKQKELFTKGCVQNGLSQKKAEEFFELIAPFAGYGFNKCLTGDTIITDSATGKQYTIAELYKTTNRIKLFSLANNLKLKPMPVTNVAQNGIKPVFEVVTRRGLRIKATGNHPFLTIDGFKDLSKLTVGDRIGTSRTAPLADKPYYIEPYKLIVLGYLLAEGNFCHPSGIYFYSTQQNEIDDFIKSAEQFDNAKISINTSKSAVAVYIGRQNIKMKNSLFQWLQELQLLNKKATQKTIPSFVYQLDELQLSLFLAKMWQGDGSITTGPGGQLFYATSSRKLASQMQHLLLRVGIISTIHNKSFSYRGKKMPGYTINISRYNNVKRFSETLGKFFIGDKAEALDAIIKNHPIIAEKIGTFSARGSKDIIPSEILPLVKQEIYASYPSLNAFVAQSGMTVRLFSNDNRKVGYLRESLQYVAIETHSEKLSNISNSDIYWDEIVSIIPKGREMTYDLTIKETHNFVANDFIVHNSHAACYAIIAFRTAYLKANYPVEFMTALLTAESRGTTGPAKNEKVAQAVLECKRLHVPVLLPDINFSQSDFSIEGGTEIRFGLSAIKNVGDAAIQNIVEARKNSPFTSFQDFCLKVNLSTINKKTMESLIKAGAFDRFGNRASMLIAFPEIVLKINQIKKNKAEGQKSLFDDDSSDVDTNTVDFTLTEIDDFTENEKLQFEKEFLGIYLTSHPHLEKLGYLKSFGALDFEEIESQLEGTRIKVGGIIDSVKKIMTKKGSEMAFLSLADEKGKNVEVVIFPKIYDMYKNDLIKDTVITVEGKLDSKNDKPAILVDRITTIDALLLDLQANTN